MKPLRSIAVSLVLLVAGFLCLAQAQMGPMLGVDGPWTRTSRTVTYTGPGNIVSGATAWWGLRGYNTAFSGNVASVCDAATGLVCGNATWAGSTLTIPTISGLVCGVGINCVVKTLYDQTGNGNDITQATLSKMPALTPSGIGSLPVMTFDGTNDELNSSATFSLTQPVTYSSVANSTASGAQQSLFYLAAGQLGYRNTGINTVFMYDGSVNSATASDGSWHALQAVFNSTSSDMNVDGNVNTADAGTDLIGPVSVANFGSTGGGQYFKGAATEMGFWNNTAFTGTQSTNMSSNQRAYWGF